MTSEHPDEAEAARQPEVVGIYTASDAGEPVRSWELVEVTPGLGIPGDRYAMRRGHWSAPRWPDKELTFVSSEVGDELSIAPELLRRNIVVRGVQLLGLIGLEFRVGSTVLAGVRPCNPCQYLEGLVGRPGLLQGLVGKGGLRTRILRGGRIAVGDTIEVLGVYDEELLTTAAGGVDHGASEHQ